LVFAALDDQHSGDEKNALSGSNTNYRNDPVAFFFIIYGLCFQTLLRMMNRDDSEAKHTVSIVLDALKKFIRPSISGNAIYKGFVFAETTDLLDRLVLMESSDVQVMVIQIATNVAKYHPSGSHIQASERFTPSRRIY
jgi:HEAT repeat-containing protein 5